MFKFLKEKLKKAVSIFTKKVEEEAEIKEEVKEVVKEVPKEPVKKVEKEGLVKKPVKKPVEEKKIEEVLEEPEEEIVPEKPVEEEIKAEIKEEPEEEAEEEIKEEISAATVAEKEEQKEEKPEKLSFFQKLFGKKEKKEEEKEEKKEEAKLEEREEKVKEAEKEEAEEKKPEAKIKIKKEKPLVAAGAEISEEPKKEAEEESEEELEEKKGFFRRIKETFTTIKLSEDKFEKLFWELEVVLLENNVAVEVIDKIKADLKADLTTGKISRKGVEELIEDSLRDSVKSLFFDKHFNIVEEIRRKKDKPYIIAFIGVNGSGKTTTMAKVAHLLLKNKLSVVFAASDTFRAAAIQQLQEHADRLGVKMIKHDYESDPAAVAFDAIKHAKAKGIDVVLIDTAGRLHVNDNLMNELKKLIRVNKPDLKIFVGESITGNDCVEQAKLFNEAAGIDVIILAKADVDEKGGAAVSVSYITKKPIIYLGTGQKYEDLTEFKPEIIIKNIGL
jgi:fused signal recognition particle receptor